MAMCTRCDGRGKLTANAVDCVMCNGTGEVGPFFKAPKVTELTPPPSPDAPKGKVLYDVTICDGKYRFVYCEDRRDEAFRNGEPWEAGRQEMIGNKSLMSLVAEIAGQREQIENHADHEIEIGKHAFEAGWKAHADSVKLVPIDELAKLPANVIEAWGRYTPPEHLTGGGDADKPA